MERVEFNCLNNAEIFLYFPCFDSKIFAGDQCCCCDCWKDSNTSDLETETEIDYVSDNVVLCIKNGIFTNFKDATKCCSVWAKKLNLPNFKMGNKQKNKEDQTIETARLGCPVPNCKGVQFMTFKKNDADGKYRLYNCKQLKKFLVHIYGIHKCHVSEAVLLQMRELCPESLDSGDDHASQSQRIDPALSSIGIGDTDHVQSDSKNEISDSDNNASQSQGIDSALSSIGIGDTDHDQSDSKNKGDDNASQSQGIDSALSSIGIGDTDHDQSDSKNMISDGDDNASQSQGIDSALFSNGIGDTDHDQSDGQNMISDGDDNGSHSRSYNSSTRPSKRRRCDDFAECLLLAGKKVLSI